MTERSAPESVAELAPAKVNIVLHVGPWRANGLHEVCSLFASIDLVDTVMVSRAERDEVDSRPPLEGPNLASAAVTAFRTAVSGELPPLRVEIEKRIPVAAGLGGGSADAAAVLRAANRIAGGPLAADDLRRLAAAMESDLEPAAVALRPELIGTRAALLDRAAIAARVSGSGPTVFGVFPDRHAAEAAAADLDERALVVGLRS